MTVQIDFVVEINGSHKQGHYADNKYADNRSR
jgi:hypothetical protein